MLLAAVHWGVHKAAGCRTLGGPGASAGSLVAGVRVPKTLGLLPTHWQVKPGSGVSAGLLVGRAGSWSLAAGPRDPELISDHWWGDWFLAQWVWGPGCSEACVDLLVDRARASWSQGRVWPAVCRLGP